MIKISSCEHTRGEVWDHKGKTELVQIFISHGDDIINFLQFLYVENGSLVLSERLTSSRLGKNFNTVKLNYPDEFLTSITGSYYICGYRGITSITFATNQRRYGPFGKPRKDDSNFNFQMGQDRPFGGFHGSTINGELETIGVYVRPIASLSKLNNAGEVKEEGKYHALDF